MKLFEQFDAPDYVIQVAHIALDLAPPDDSNIVGLVPSSIIKFLFPTVLFDWCKCQ